MADALPTLEEIAKTAPSEEQSILGQLLADETATAVKGSESDPKKESGTPSSAEVEILQRQLEYEQQRNNSLQGRMDSQFRPLNQTVRELQQQLATVQTEKPVSEAKSTVQSLLAELSPEDRETFGEKQLAIVAKLIEKPTQSMVNQVRDDLQQGFEGRMKEIEERVAGQTGQALWDKVDQLSPGVRALNNTDDPQWVAFLNGVDLASGQLRKTLGNAAVDAGDVARLALLHEEFLEETGQKVGKAKEEEGKTDKEKQEENRELRPEGSRAEPAVGSSEKPTIKGGEVTQFYADLAKGKYDDKPELVEKMETLIAEALQDGRVLD